MIVALWDRARLAEDWGVEDPADQAAFTLAYNVREPAEVDAIVDEVRAAGATITREPGETFWGGYRRPSRTPTATRGRSPTTRAGPSRTTAARCSRGD